MDEASAEYGPERTTDQKNEAPKSTEPPATQRAEKRSASAAENVSCTTGERIVTTNAGTSASATTSARPTRARTPMRRVRVTGHDSVNAADPRVRSWSSPPSPSTRTNHK